MPAKQYEPEDLFLHRLIDLSMTAKHLDHYIRLGLEARFEVLGCTHCMAYRQDSRGCKTDESSPMQGSSPAFLVCCTETL